MTSSQPPATNGSGALPSDLGGENKDQENTHQDPSNPSSDSSTQDSNKEDESPSRKPLWRRFYSTLFWVPPQARFDPSSPPAFSMALNILFAFAGAFTVANLYYNHPILNILADDFGVPYETVSQIPTLAQAGYAIGLFFLCPLGDLFKRRPFVLSLVFFTATMR